MGRRNHFNLLLMYICHKLDLSTKGRLLQRKKLLGFCYHRRRIYHTGINDMDLVQVPIQIQSDHFFCNDPCPVSGWFLYRIAESGVHIHMLLGKISSSHFSQHKKLCMRIFCNLLLSQLENIVVISSGQTFICGYYNIADLSFLRLYLRPLIEIFMLDIRHMTEDTADGRLKGIEIRLSICQYLLCLLHFRRRNHIHGIGDLHRILNTFNTALNFFCACHLITYSCS